MFQPAWLPNLRRGTGPRPSLDAGRLFLFGLGIFLTIHLGLRLALSPSLEPDDADLALFSQTLAWGYSEQPPFYSWLVWGFVRVLGLSIFTLTLVKSLILGWLVIALRDTARLLLSDQRLVIPVVMGVVLQPTFSWHAVSYLTHSLLLCAVCMALLHRAVQLRLRRATFDYVLLGVLVGIGLLSKYNFVFFAAALFVAGLTVPGYRTAILDRRLWISVAIAVVMVVPHAFWVLENWNVVWGSLASKTGAHQPRNLINFGKGIGNLTQNAVLMMLALFGLLAIITRTQWSEWRHRPIVNPEAVSLLQRFFIAVGLLLTMQVLIGGTTKFHERWLQPFALVVPLWLFLRIEGWKLETRQIRQFVVCGMIGLLVVTIARTVQIRVGGRDDGVYPLQMHFEPLAKQLEAIGAQNAIIVASDRVIGGNLALCFPKSQVWCAGHAAFQPQHAGDRPMIAVWHLNWGPVYPPKMAVFVETLIGSYLPTQAPIYGVVPPVLPRRPTNHVGFVRLEPVSQ